MNLPPARWLRSPLLVVERLGKDRAARIVTLLAVSLAIFLSVGRMAFNITDEGLILDWSYRILHGAVPHKDIVDTHLLGSGLLHIIDLAAPTPVLATSRLIAITQWVAYSSILAAATFATPFRRWRPLHLCAVLVATVINLHTFPIMAWYTVDGILLCSIGIYLLMSAPRPLPKRRTAIAMLLFGGALLMKQSFGPAPILGAVTIGALSFREGWQKCLGKAFAGGLVSALPFAIYTGWVSLAGGLPDMIRQLASATPVWGLDFLTASTLGPDGVDPLLWPMAIAIISHLGGERLRAAGYRMGGTLQLVGSVLGAATIFLLLAQTQLSPVGTWGSVIETFLVQWLVVSAVLRRRFDGTAFWFGALGWMVSLSYGPNNNDLVAGSIVILLLHRLWTAAPELKWLAKHPTRRAPLAARGRAVGRALPAAVHGLPLSANVSLPRPSGRPADKRPRPSLGRLRLD